MIRLLLGSMAWLAVGHALVGALFWALVHVPESNVLMLAASALLAVITVLTAAWVEQSAALAWVPHLSYRDRARRAAAGIPAFLAALLLFLVIWWAMGVTLDWLAAKQGEMDAWLMLHLGWARTAWLHAALAWAIWLVRYPLAVTVVGTLWMWRVSVTARADTRGGPASSMLVPQRPPVRVLLIALWLLVFVWLPWQVVYWRPRGIPPFWPELLLVAVKLGSIYLLANLGWALVLGTLVLGAVRQGAKRQP